MNNISHPQVPIYNKFCAQPPCAKMQFNLVLKTCTYYNTLQIHIVHLVVNIKLFIL
jgi:hypothetical protein